MGSWKSAISPRHWKFAHWSLWLSERHFAALHNVEKGESFNREAAKLGEDLGSENLDDSRKQALRSKLEQLVTKLDSSHAAILQIVKSKFATDWLTTLSNNKKCQDLLKQLQPTAESGNQTSLV